MLGLHAPPASPPDPSLTLTPLTKVDGLRCGVHVRRCDVHVRRLVDRWYGGCSCTIDRWCPPRALWRTLPPRRSRPPTFTCAALRSESTEPARHRATRTPRPPRHIHRACSAPPASPTSTPLHPTPTPPVPRPYSTPTPPMLEPNPHPPFALSTPASPPPHPSRRLAAPAPSPTPPLPARPPSMLRPPHKPPLPRLCRGACAPLLIENLFERDVDGLIDRDEIAAFDRRAGADASR